jgi:type I restriction enzyme M protein
LRPAERFGEVIMPPRRTLTDAVVLALPHVAQCIDRGFVAIEKGKITYNLNQKKQYSWADPEEWIRCNTVCHLIINKHYPANRIRVEVVVPRRTPSDHADIIVYRDDRCREPYLIVENKAEGQTAADRAQGIEQLFGNANSLRGPLGLYDEGSNSIFYNVGEYQPTERQANKRGTRDNVPEQYGQAPQFAYVAGAANDIKAASRSTLENKIRRAHSIIWAGGKRDPLTAFDEWSKLLFAKVNDERHTRTGSARAFQVGTNETTASVSNRIHDRFAAACAQDPSVFKTGAKINLPDKKITEVVQCLQDISFVMTDVDTIGAAFESFFGSVFRGELGQYFTMRQLARFTVAASDVTEEDYCLDPTAGSGGFLLEILLQVWHRIDREFAGQRDIDRTKLDFALHKVFGIEIHEVLARICKINLVLHHDGHTNVEGDKSCLDAVFSRPRLNPPEGKFTKIFGNPPFGDEVKEGDEDHLGENTLDQFKIAAGREQVASEHVILERCIDLLEPVQNSRFGLILPDGIFNNQGELSNCPQVRRMLVRRGQIEAIVSLPDYAFRKSGAQNKTSILLFRRYTAAEQVQFDQLIEQFEEAGLSEDDAIGEALAAMPYKIFLAEANSVGYTTTGAHSPKNDLYRGAEGGRLEDDQSGTILGELRAFRVDPAGYAGRRAPDCMAVDAAEVWAAHPSHRLDPKYHLFKREELEAAPDGWCRRSLSQVLHRREDFVEPEQKPDEEVRVMTISQAGEIRPRAAGKGRNPPEWLGMYFEDSPSTWFQARAGDVVFSSIDLWKGCVAVVPEHMDGALVTKEFPIYQITDANLHPEFLSVLLRSRYYQRAFRAITTGHSNRRRTQVDDFESLEIAYPPTRDEQHALIAEILKARAARRTAANSLAHEMRRFSNIIDGRGNEVLPDVVEEAAPEEGEAE